jgi:hypothetical protein
MVSFIYKHALIYRWFMRIYYMGHYGRVSRKVADIIPENSSVVELCCADSFLYIKFLRDKNVDYKGVDYSRKVGVDAEVADVTAVGLPDVDSVIMLRSLYQFLPDVMPVIEQMYAACRQQVIIMEPVKTLSSSDSKILSWIAKRAANPGDGHKMHRFDESSFRSLLEDRFGSAVRFLENPSSRDMLAIISKV